MTLSPHVKVANSSPTLPEQETMFCHFSTNHTQQMSGGAHGGGGHRVYKNQRSAARPLARKEALHKTIGIGERRMCECGGERTNNGRLNAGACLQTTELGAEPRFRRAISTLGTPPHPTPQNQDATSTASRKASDHAEFRKPLQADLGACKILRVFRDRTSSRTTKTTLPSSLYGQMSRYPLMLDCMPCDTALVTHTTRAATINTAAASVLRHMHDRDMPSAQDALQEARFVAELLEHRAQRAKASTKIAPRHHVACLRPLTICSPMLGKLRIRPMTRRHNLAAQTIKSNAYADWM